MLCIDQPHLKPVGWEGSVFGKECKFCLIDKGHFDIDGLKYLSGTRPPISFLPFFLSFPLSRDVFRGTEFPLSVKEKMDDDFIVVIH